jgi:hypothetical protein
MKSRQKETNVEVDDIEIGNENGKRKGYITVGPARQSPGPCLNLLQRDVCVNEA